MHAHSTMSNASFCSDYGRTMETFIEASAWRDRNGPAKRQDHKQICQGLHTGSRIAPRYLSTEVPC